jgi:hypothetical protein
MDTTFSPGRVYFIIGLTIVSTVVNAEKEQVRSKPRDPLGKVGAKNEWTMNLNSQEAPLKQSINGKKLTSPKNMEA